MTMLIFCENYGTLRSSYRYRQEGNEVMANRHFLRRRLITNEVGQAKYLSMLITYMLIPFLFFVVSFNYLLYKIALTQQELQPQIPYDTFTIMMKINYAFLLGFPPNFIIILLLGAVLSHRFAGPFKRIKIETDAMAESGDIEKRLYVRKSDDIKPVVDSFNHLLDSLSKKYKQ